MALALFVLLSACTTYGNQPDAQQEFVAAVESVSEQARTGNELTRADLARSRETTICAQMPPGGEVSDWTGKVSKISANVEGMGILVVQVSEHLRLETGYNERAEKVGKGYISDPVVLGELRKLRTGDGVTFSGSFVPTKELCVYDMNLFRDNNLQTPRYMFGFSSVSYSD